MKLSEIFRAAKIKLATTDTWCQKNYAMPEHRMFSTPWTADDAHCFCVTGAVMNVEQAFDPVDSIALAFMCRVAGKEFNYNPIKVNDTLGFEAVHKLLDLCIQRSEQDENQTRIS